MKDKVCNIVSILIFLFIIGNVNANDLQVYESLTFAEASDLAILNSKDLRHSRASLALLEEAWRWGLRAYFPRISLSASENDRLQQFGPDSFIKNYGVNLDQLLFDGGRTRMSRSLEKMELNLSSTRLDRMASETGEAAIAAYRNVLSSRTILEIRKDALVVLEEQIRILNEEVTLGLALGIDLASANINLADAKLGIYSLELDLIEMEKQFAEILGLDYLPVLTEKVDINRAIVLPEVMMTTARARENNPELVEARYSITKRQAELKYVSNSWIPTMRFTGNFGVSGQHYPLTRYNWSVGINIEFAGPWIQNRIGFQMGWEPPHDRTAMLQNSLTPLPDPASSIGKNQAKLALELEQENYALVYERIARIAANALEKYAFADQRRGLALQAVELGAERCRVEEVRLGLGHITRINLMESLIEQTQREIAAIEAATALLEAERELERFLDLRPGELESFASEILQRRTE